MFQNYLKTALRSLYRDKLFTAINVFGLAIGLAACILIALFVRDEFSYDKHWANAENIYQVNTTFSFPGSPPGTSSRVSGRAKEALKLYFPADIQSAVRFNRMNTIVRVDSALFSEQIHWTDSEVLDVFNFETVSGDLQATLADNSSLAISESFALKYFGETDPVGQTLGVKVYTLDRDYRIGAVFKDLPHNTTLSFQALAMIDEGDFAAARWEFDDWYSSNGWLYLKTPSAAAAARIGEQLPQFVNDNIEVPARISGEDDIQATDYWNLSLQPISDIQLNAAGRGLMKPGGDEVKVMAFITIAGLILLVACINFVNLSTAKATKRAREVALRKVLGAHRKQLIVQYLGESILLAGAALLIALVVVEVVLPAFSAFLDKELVLQYSDGDLIKTLVGLLLTVGIVAGAYPALIITGFMPAQILKANKSTDVGGASSLRQALVVFQFAISIGLIVATGVIYGQMHYSSNMDLGYNKNNLFSVLNVGREDARGVRKTLRDELAKLPGVTGVALSATRPAGQFNNFRSVQVPGEEARGIGFKNQMVDHDFFETYEIELLAGRTYDRNRSADGIPSTEGVEPGEVLTGTVVLNKMAVEWIGYGTPEQALGKAIRIEAGRKDGEIIFADLEIIGVVANALFHRPRSERGPEGYFMADNAFYGGLVARYEGNPVQLVEQMRDIWTSLVPSLPFQYEFVEDAVNINFVRERHLAMLLGTFALLAILIACLGLYGLASFTAERRTKEIGIRKVLGATVSDIVRLLVWQFSKPVLLANLISWPLAAWAMISWLETFPYRMDFWYLAPLCLIAGMTTLAIAWATVGGNAAKVARTNPIFALRYE